MGTRRIYRGRGRKRRLKEVTDTMVYVPLLKTLQILLQDEGIYTEVCMKHKCKYSIYIYISGIIIVLYTFRFKKVTYQLYQEG